jgi:hypothetical protein
MRIALKLAGAIQDATGATDMKLVGLIYQIITHSYENDKEIPWKWMAIGLIREIVRTRC